VTIAGFKHHTHMRKMVNDKDVLEPPGYRMGSLP
jgi:hypothetical protein